MELDEGWTKGESFERFITQRSPHCTVANGFSVIFAKVLVGISGNPRRMYLFAYGSHWQGSGLRLRGEYSQLCGARMSTSLGEGIISSRGCTDASDVMGTEPRGTGELGAVEQVPC